MPRRLLQRDFWRSAGGLLVAAVIVAGALLTAAVLVRGHDTAMFDKRSAEFDQRIAEATSDNCERIHKVVQALIPDRIAEIKDTREFLLMHPQGITGISDKMIRRGLNRDVTTLRLLLAADCTEGRIHAGS